MTEKQHSGRFAIIPAQAVEDRRLGAAALRVLTALSTYSDRDGWCHPAVSTFAERIGITRQAAQRHIRALAGAGYLEVRQRKHKNGRNRSNKYRLLFDRALFVMAEGAEKVGQHDVALGGEGNVTLHSEKSLSPAVPSNETAEKVGQRHVAGEGNVRFAQNVPTKNERKNIDASDDSNTQAKPRKQPAAEKLYDGKTVEQWFDIFWDIIPKRTDGRNVRARSLVFFTKHLKAGEAPTEIIAGAQRERDRHGAKHEYAYAPQNWLRDKGWENNRTDAERPYTEAEIAG